MPTVNELLADDAMSHAVDLAQYSQSVVRRLIALLNRTDADLAAALARALERLPQNSFTVERLEALLGAVRRLNTEAYRRVEVELKGVLEEFAAYEAEYQHDLFRARIPGPIQAKYRIAQVSIDQVYSAALSRPFQGRLLRNWAKKLSADRLEVVRSTVRMGYIEGQTTAEIVRRLLGTPAQRFADGSLQRARRDLTAVVHTAISHTAEMAREKFFGANTDLLGAVVWQATLDTRTSEVCFPGSTRVLPIGDLRGVISRHYKGDLIVVTTAAGKQVSATPHHPVLTSRGWRPIEELNPGKDVLYRALGDICCSACAKNVGVPPTISAVADALSHPAIANVETKRSSKADFHGDGMVGEHKVHVPRAQGGLWTALVSVGHKQVADCLLSRPHCATSFAPGRTSDALVVSDDSTLVPAEGQAVPVEDRIEARLTDANSFGDLRWAHAIAKQGDDLGFVRSSSSITATEREHYASAFQDSSDGGGRDFVVPCNRCGRLAVRVAADDVVSVQREFFVGHVYNLSTSTESYIADGFVVHNCRIRDGLKYTADRKHRPIGHAVPWLQGPGRSHWRCRSTSRPATKSWRELGFDVDELDAATRASMDGQVPGDVKFGEWLQRQSAYRQDQVVGAVRGRLMRKGKLSFDQLYSDRGEWLSIDELRERDAAAFTAAGL